MTSNEANACTISRCESKSVNATHQYYVFAVVDDNGNSYEWEDSVLESGVDKNAIKVAIHDHLLTLDKLPVKDEVTWMADDLIIGESVSQTSP